MAQMEMWLKMRFLRRSDGHRLESVLTVSKEDRDTLGSFGYGDYIHCRYYLHVYTIEHPACRTQTGWSNFSHKE